MLRVCLSVAIAVVPISATGAILNFGGEPAQLRSIETPSFFPPVGTFAYSEQGFDVSIRGGVDIPSVGLPIPSMIPSSELGRISNDTKIFSHTFTRQNGQPFSLERIDLSDAFTGVAGFASIFERDPVTGRDIGFITEDMFAVTWDNIKLVGGTRAGGRVERDVSAWQAAEQSEPVIDMVLNAPDFGPGFDDLTSLEISWNRDSDPCHPTNFGRPDPSVELENFCTGQPFDRYETDRIFYELFDIDALEQGGPPSFAWIDRIELGERASVAPIPLPASAALLSGAIALLGAARTFRGRRETGSAGG